MDKHTYRKQEVAKLGKSMFWENIVALIAFTAILGFWVCAIVGFITILLHL